MSSMKRLACNIQASNVAAIDFYADSAPGVPGAAPKVENSLHNTLCKRAGLYLTF
jgi:hypothetical protein